MKITFYGGARSVTGANYLLEHNRINPVRGRPAEGAATTASGRSASNGVKILVDCGLNQGTMYAEELNYRPFEYNPSEINFVFITHSHIDHIGRLPKLYKDGFRGKVFTTTATRDLMSVALPDNMKLILEEAGEMGHEPLFKQENLDGLMPLVEGMFYGEPIELDGITAIFHDAGHILGSSIIEIRWMSQNQKSKIKNQKNGIKKIYFSGDLGNPPTPLLRQTEEIKDADYIVVESAYGDRVHEGREERRSKLISVIEDTIKRGGVLMIPSFAIERTQELLHELNGLFNDKKIPRVPVFVDSPLANKITAVYQKHPEYFNKETAYLINSGDDVFNFPGLKLTTTTEESKKINDVLGPKIIIAGSGMSQGGRILHHEIRYLPDTASTILFVGYQVDGSLGRRIQKGEKEVKIMGQNVSVKCHIENLSAYSAHADQPGLLKWVGGSTTEGGGADSPRSGGAGNLKKVFVVQGEDESSKTLANLIHERYGIEAVAPVEGEEFEL